MTAAIWFGLAAIALVGAIVLLYFDRRQRQRTGHVRQVWAKSQGYTYVSVEPSLASTWRRGAMTKLGYLSAVDVVSGNRKGEKFVLFDLEDAATMVAVRRQIGSDIDMDLRLKTAAPPKDHDLELLGAVGDRVVFATNPDIARHAVDQRMVHFIERLSPSMQQLWSEGNWTLGMMPVGTTSKEWEMAVDAVLRLSGLLHVLPPETGEEHGRQGVDSHDPGRPVPRSFEDSPGVGGSHPRQGDRPLDEDRYHADEDILPARARAPRPAPDVRPPGFGADDRRTPGRDQFDDDRLARRDDRPAAPGRPGESDLGERAPYEPRAGRDGAPVEGNVIGADPDHDGEGAEHPLPQRNPGGAGRPGFAERDADDRDAGIIGAPPAPERPDDQGAGEDGPGDQGPLPQRRPALAVVPDPRNRIRRNWPPADESDDNRPDPGSDIRPDTRADSEQAESGRSSTESDLPQRPGGPFHPGFRPYQGPAPR